MKNEIQNLIEARDNETNTVKAAAIQAEIDLAFSKLEAGFQPAERDYSFDRLMAQMG